MFLRTFSSLIHIPAAVFAMVAGAHGATVSIGTAHFTNGQTGIGSGTFNSAVAAQPAPFNQFLGGDVAGPDFDATWTFTYTPVSTVLAATLTIGVYDGDFAATGQQLNLMEIDGVVISGIAGPVFEAGPGATGQYGIYTIVLPATVYPGLFDGSATVHMTLAGPGGGVVGETTNNGAGIDFARLDIQEIPETGAGLLILAGGLFMASQRRRAVRTVA